MKGISAVSIFCQDIRNEVGGIETLVGVLPDNVEVPATPGALPKLCVFTRINFLPEYDPVEISIVLVDLDGNEMSRVNVGRETIEQALNPKNSHQKELSGIKSILTSVNVPIPKAGVFRMIVETRDEKILSGVLNITVGLEEASSPKSNPDIQSDSSAH